MLKLEPDVLPSKNEKKKKATNPDIFHRLGTNKQKCGCVTKRQQVTVNDIVQMWFHSISNRRKDKNKCFWF